MTEAWKQWEGHIVDGAFRLRQYLGGSESSAVFLTESDEPEPGKAAIKLVAAEPEAAEQRISRWALASKLSHPHLIRLLHIGREKTDPPLPYVVMEYAEEDLSQALRQRALTANELRETLEAVLDALDYLHAQGLVHAHVKPANLLAVGDRLKLSVDGVCPSGESPDAVGERSAYDAPEIAESPVTPAADVWSLGVTLVEALTQRVPAWAPGLDQPVLPDSLPAPFADIARACLRRDPRQRCTLRDIRGLLRPAPRSAGVPEAAKAEAKPAPAPSGPVAASTPAVRRYAAPAAIAVLALAAIIAGSWLLSRRNPEPSRQQTEPVPAVQSKDQPEARPAAAAPAGSESNASAEGLVPGEVVHRVMPDVPLRARNTIHGRVRVNVRVQVDPSGKVDSAKIESSASRYFSGLALRSSRAWEFAPAKKGGQPVASSWLLRFEFMRHDTRVVPVRAAE